jgi:hypothetical protein
LQITICQGFTKIVAKDDSQIVVSMLRKLQIRFSPRKVSNNWHIEEGLEHIVVEFLYLGKWSLSVIESLTLKGKSDPHSLYFMLKSK